jgi:hypothetical protein
VSGFVGRAPGPWYVIRGALNYGIDRFGSTTGAAASIRDVRLAGFGG